MYPILNLFICVYALCVWHEGHYTLTFLCAFLWLYKDKRMTLILDLLTDDIDIRESTQMIILETSDVSLHHTNGDKQLHNK